MRVQISAVGRLRNGPEKQLIDDYLTRFTRTGRAYGFSDISITEVEDKKGGGKETEADLLLATIPKASKIITLDEHGKILSSPQFSQKLSHWRDDAPNCIVFIIGGADGLSEKIKSQASFSISLGKMVWPHMLVRLMLSEQLYRATSIMANNPYHRE